MTDQPEARPEIYSWGHRNPQGLAIHPQTGDIWAAEHGPQGGDEINLIRAGANFGWPVITYGEELLFDHLNMRMRGVENGPDGVLYLLSENGSIFAIANDASHEPHQSDHQHYLTNDDGSEDHHHQPED
ncbi:MAG: PQQ-dependent sugar dehydrogenase [Halioglobus sp.]